MRQELVITATCLRLSEVFYFSDLPRGLYYTVTGLQRERRTRDPRLLAEAHGAAELRIVAGAGHRLRHDPRAVAILLGWLDRERNRVTTTR